MKSDLPATLIDRLKSELRLKLLLLVALNVIVWTPYITLQRIHFFQPTVMPLTFADRAIPFMPRAVWIYFSIYALMPIGPFLMNNREQLFRYSKGVVGITAFAAVIFLFWPTICLRPPAPGADPLYRALVSIDQPFHAFPSLHAAFAVYSCLCVIHVGRAVGWSDRFEVGFVAWTALILLATLATRQHVLADIVGGGALGFAAYQICLRKSAPTETAGQAQFSHET
jgi:hypothetical protein